MNSRARGPASFSVLPGPERPPRIWLLGHQSRLHVRYLCVWEPGWFMFRATRCAGIVRIASIGT
eukprot:5486080-Alexandrium_andersonii.AAC.1